MSLDPNFDHWLQELIDYRQKYGDCLVPIGPGPNWELGIWVNTLRLQKRYYELGDPASCLDAGQIATLEKLGFDWDADGRHRGVAAAVSPEVVRQSEGIAKSCPRALQKILEDDFGEQDHRYSSSHRVRLATRTWKQTPDEIKQTMPRVEGDNVEQKLREWKVKHFGERTRVPVSVPASSEDHPVPDCLVPLLQADVARHPKGSELTNKMIYAALRRKWKQVPQEAKDLLPHEDDPDYFSKLQDWKLQNIPDAADALDAESPPQKQIPVLCPQSLVPLLRDDFARHPRRSRLQDWHLDLALKRRWEEVSQEAKDLLPHEDDPDYFSKLQGWKLQHIPDAADALDVESPPQIQIPLLCPQSLVPLLLDDFARHPKGSKLKDRRLDSSLKRRWEEVSQAAKDLLPHEDDPDYVSKLQDWKLQHIPDAAEARDAMDKESPPKCSEVVMPESECWPPALQKIFECDFAAQDPRYSESHRRTLTNRIWRQTPNEIKQTIPIVEGDDAEQELQEWKEKHFGERSRIPLGVHGCPCVLVPLLQEDFVRHPIGSRLQNRELGQAMKRRWKQVSQAARDMLPDENDPDYFSKLKNWKLQHIPDAVDEKNFKTPNGSHFKTPKGSLSKLKVVESVQVAAPKSAPTSVTHDGESARLPGVATAHSILNADSTRNESAAAMEFSDDDYVEQNTASNEQTDDGDEGFQPASDWDLGYMELKSHMRSLYPNGGFVECCECESEKLGDWVAWQRYIYSIKKLSPERIARLEELGFLWKEKEETEEARANATAGKSPIREHLSDDESNEANSSNPNSVDMSQSERKCLPLKPPIPSKYQGDMEEMKSASVPEFTSLVNFPSHMSQKQASNLPDGMRCCVMCGQARPCNGGKKKGGSKKSDGMGDKSYAIIPSQNKGLCTLCDVNVWVVCNSGLEIKWCKGCKNFRPWAAFGDKGLATKCLRCREHQREKYALQKEEDGPDGELSQSKSHLDETENDSDAESNEENGDSETTTSFDRHFEKLKRHMEAHHPNGGYVEQSKVHPLGTRRWMMQLRWMYRDIKAGNKTKLTEAQIRKLENIGFWWEWDEPIAKKQGKTAKSSKQNSIAKPLNTWHARTMQTGEQQSQSARVARGVKKGAIPNAQIRKLESSGFWGEKAQPIKEGITGKSPIQEHLSDDESNDDDSSIPNSQDEDGPDLKSDNHSDSDGELSQSKSYPDDAENDSDAESNEVDGDSETPTAFDRHFEKLKPHMESHYPNGGYVEQNKVHPLATRRWMLQVRWMYRDRKAGNKTKLTEAQIRKLENIGFWWEKDQPVAKKKGKTAKSSKQNSIVKPLNTGHARTIHTGKHQSRRARQARGVKKAAIPWEVNYGKLARFMKKHYPDGGYVRLSTGDEKFSGWVRNQRCQYRKRCMSGRSQLSDDQFEKLKKLGFRWQNPEKNEKSTEPDEENESSESEIEQELASEQDDKSENEDSESANSSESSEEEEDKPGRQSHSMPVARRNAHTGRTSNVGAYTSKTKKELLRLLKTQLDRVERLKNDKVELQSELQECESKLSKSEDDNHSLRIKIQDLEHEQEKLGDENISLTVCNNNLRRSHIKAMMEERAHIQRETKRRKLAEDQLEKAKKLIPMELDSAIFR